MVRPTRRGCDEKLPEASTDASPPTDRARGHIKYGSVCNVYT